MKNLLKSNDGVTLVEIIIAIAVFVVVSSMAVTVMVSSQKITMNNYEQYTEVEKKIGVMDQTLNSNSGIAGEEVDVKVDFPDGSSVTLDATKMLDSDYHIGIIKKN